MDQPDEATPEAGAKASTRSPLSRFFNGLTLFIALGSLAIFLCSLCGRNFLVSELMSNFRLQIAGLMLPFAVIVFRMKTWRWLAWALIAAVTWSLITLGWVYIPTAQPPVGPETIRVMSYNVLGHNEKRQEVIEQIKEADPDVVLVLEYSSGWHNKLEPLYNAYPHRVLQPRWHGFGMALLSKYPLTDTEVVALTKDKTDNPSIVTSVVVGGQTIRFAGLHSLSPTTQYRYELRNRQFEDLANHLAQKDIPTVVMGDFNCTPWSPFLKDFVKTTDYRDSRRGFGYQVSWPTTFLMLQIPIDHAFVSKDIHVHSRRVGESIGSDHMPIIFEVSTARKNSNN